MVEFRHNSVKDIPRLSSQALPRVSSLAAGHAAILPLQLDHGTHSEEEQSEFRA